jgi:hypothetical protein
VTERGRRLLRGLLALALAGSLVPEVARYRAERQLGLATSAVRAVLVGGAVNPSDERLLRAASLARDAAARLPGDSRPFIAEGSARLLARQPEAAIEAYLAALRRGERAEVDLNLGRASMMLRRRPEAERALLRSAWISPPLLVALPDNVAAILRGEVARLEALLVRGELKAPPP